MRILHVFDHSIPLHSGYAFRSLAILKEQRKRGYETFHVTSIKHYSSEQPIEEVDGFVFHRTFPTWMSKLPVLNQLDVVITLQKEIEKLVKEYKIDIIHAHSPSLNAWAASRVAKKCDIPYVYEMRASWEDAAVSHGTCKEGDLRYKLGQWLEKSALKAADKVTTICQGLANQIAEWGVEKANITVIPNAVDIEKFSVLDGKDEALSKKLGLEGKRVLGFLGSFYRYEGIHLLIDAMPAILAKNPDARALLVGGGQEEENLRAQVKRLGLEEQVIFVGRVPHEEVPAYYSLVDIFVYPRESIRLTELVTPLKPLEAMAQHGLVAASNVGGHREMVEDGVNGRLFEADNPAALAGTINDMFSQQGNWENMRKAGRSYVEQARCWEKSVANIQPVYDALLSEKAR